MANKADGTGKRDKGLPRRYVVGFVHEGDYSLINLALLFCIFVVTLTIIVQTVLLYLSQRSTERAEKEVAAIGTAIVAFRRDLGMYPIYQRGVNIDSDTAPGVLLLFGPGTLPWITLRNTAWMGHPQDTFDNQLIKNAPGYPTSGPRRWKGPYLKSPVAKDPWGNRYLCNAAGLHPKVNNASWVLSAGPNRAVDTDFYQSMEPASLGGDDIGFRIK
jgi:hypothetical protein